MNIRNIDLNLLVVFDALMLECNVSRAAEKIFLSQPAMSHSLRKLREQLNDPILIRSGNQMVPSELALSLHGPVKKILHEIETYFKPQEDFNAASSAKNFVIASTDYVECMIIPLLVEHIAKIAPNVRLHVEVLLKQFPLDDLEKAAIDIAIGIDGHLRLPGHMQCASWLDDELVGMLRKGHNLAIEKRLSEEQFSELEHVYYVPMYSPTAVDNWFQDKGLVRQIAYQSESYLSAAYVVERSNYILVLPRRLAQRMLSVGELALVDLPIDIPRFQMNWVWHPLVDKDPAHVWLREQLRIVGGQL